MIDADRILLFLLVFMAGCSTTDGRPIYEMVFASAALKAAKRSDAERKSPDYFRRSEAAYWQAKGFYASRRFEDARQAAYLARRYAENAEKDADLSKQAEEGSF